MLSKQHSTRCAIRRINKRSCRPRSGPHRPRPRPPPRPRPRRRRLRLVGSLCPRCLRRRPRAPLTLVSLQHLQWSLRTCSGRRRRLHNMGQLFIMVAWSVGACCTHRQNMRPRQHPDLIRLRDLPGSQRLVNIQRAAADSQAGVELPPTTTVAAAENPEAQTEGLHEKNLKGRCKEAWAPVSCQQKQPSRSTLKGWLL